MYVTGRKKRPTISPQRCHYITESYGRHLGFRRVGHWRRGQLRFGVRRRLGPGLLGSGFPQLDQLHVLYVEVVFGLCGKFDDRLCGYQRNVSEIQSVEKTRNMTKMLSPLNLSHATRYNKLRYIPVSRPLHNVLGQYRVFGMQSTHPSRPHNYCEVTQIYGLYF